MYTNDMEPRLDGLYKQLKPLKNKWVVKGKTYLTLKKC